jgi:putative hydrolase of the HAD superfamily
LRAGADIRCVAFDVDDTLYLERDYVRSGFSAAGAWASRQLAVEGFVERAWSLFERGHRGRIFNEALIELGVRPEPQVVDALVRVYREHTPAIALLPDARRCLGELRGRIFLAVITDGPAVSQRAKVEALGLPALVDMVVLTSELGDGLEKPHPRAFELVQAAAGVEGALCAYVADNPAKDFMAPRRLGWRTVRVVRPLGLHAGRDSGADVDSQVATLDDLTSALSRRAAAVGPVDGAGREKR